MDVGSVRYRVVMLCASMLVAWDLCAFFALKCVAAWYSAIKQSINTTFAPAMRGKVPDFAKQKSKTYAFYAR